MQAPANGSTPGWCSNVKSGRTVQTRQKVESWLEIIHPGSAWNSESRTKQVKNTEKHVNESAQLYYVQCNVK